MWVGGFNGAEVFDGFIEVSDGREEALEVSLWENASGGRGPGEERGVHVLPGDWVVGEVVCWTVVSRA